MPLHLTRVGDLVFFAADDGVHGRELWISDGTLNGTRMLKDINRGRDSSLLAHFSEVDGLLFFRADDGLHGRELWVSDGTAEGTRMVRDINPGSSPST